MMSLFSNFDIYFYPLVSIMIMSFLIIFLSNFFLLNMMKLSLSIFYLNLNKMMMEISNKTHNKMMMVMLISIITMMATMNFLSILPFIFPFNTQMSSTFFLSLTLWISLNLLYLIFNWKMFLAHCVPEGSPLILSFFLLLIELISNMIRPLTLSIRIMANIMAGHMIMILLSKLTLYYTMMTPFYLMLNLIEIFVAFIQSYIFMVMISLYFSELS